MGCFQMRTAGKGLFLRSCTTWLVLVLLLLSCTAQPPAVKAPSQALPSGSPSVVSKIPASFFYSRGQRPAALPQEALPPLDFKIQDYPNDALGSELLALNIDMNWPVLFDAPTSASITPENAQYQAFGFRVEEWGSNQFGQRIATLIAVGLNFNAGYTGSFGLQRSLITYPTLYFRSSDGIHYALSNGPSNEIPKGYFNFYYTRDIDNSITTTCDFWSTGGFFVPMQSGTVVLDPIAETLQLNAFVSSSIDLSGQNWLNISNPESPVYRCANIGNSGSASVSMQMTLKIPFIKERADTIDVIAEPGEFEPQNSHGIKIKVAPSNPSRAWTLKAKAKQLLDTCTFAEKPLATGLGNKEEISFGVGVPDGEYELIAEYDDANAPKEPGKTTVTADSEVAFLPTLYVVTLGTHATFAIKQPICPKAKLTLVSGTIRSTVPGSEEVTCQAEDFGTAGSQFTWDGVCQGPNGDVSGTGTVEFKLEAAGKTALASVTIQAPSTGPTASPRPTSTPISKPTAKPDCPPGTECPTPTPPEPTNRPCPEGAICTPCPLAGCKGTPQPTHPTPLPEPACPPDGICALPEPEPECPAGAVCPEPGTPTPCPAGAICAPPPEPEPDGNGECPNGYILDQGLCIYCPRKYFGYQSGVGCYVEMGFGVEHVSINESAPSSPVTFSPRDINQLFDKVRFNTTANTKNFPGANFVKWDMKLKSQKGNWDDGDVFVNYLGLDSILYDGWNEKQACLIDGKYTARFLPKPLVGAGADPPQVLVQVPDYPHGVPVKIFMINQIGVNKDTVPFHVDNTPPVVKNLTIQEELVNAQEESYKTNISFTLIDPVVNESGATLSEAEIINGKNQLTDNALKIFVDDAPFYTSPAVDLDGFWIASAREKRPQELDDWSLEKPTDRSANVRFSLPYRLAGHTLEVEVKDTLANTGRYILYPQGGN